MKSQEMTAREIEKQKELLLKRVNLAAAKEEKLVACERARVILIGKNSRIPALRKIWA